VQKLQLTIPAQDRTGPAIRIKPRDVREWLENLPYLDLQRAANIASQQLRIMNRQPMATTARVETLGDFLRAYQRLGESVPSTASSNEGIRTLLKRWRTTRRRQPATRRMLPPHRAAATDRSLPPADRHGCDTGPLFPPSHGIELD